MRTSQHGAEHGFDQALCHPQSVHLLIHLRGDWHSDRESLVAELLRRTESAQAYARSAAFLKAYPQRVGVVRVQTEGTAPSVIDSVLGERGIELENLAGAGVDAEERAELLAARGQLLAAAAKSPLLAAVRPDGLEDAAQLELQIDAARPLLGKPTPCVGREAELRATERLGEQRGAVVAKEHVCRAHVAMRDAARAILAGT